ncbi:Pyrimidine-specific ribonucleoside hydrolase rihA [Edwardsiella ictaluri]|nr:Pyrimidine-specific ribonucleoside hydrolase rihA [Edwardsiella ictaluri]
MALPLIIDCDPGHDDAIALILAHLQPRAGGARHHRQKR